MHTITVPNITEEISTFKVIKLSVAEQSHVLAEQAICELETDKIVLEIPAPATGQIHWLVQLQDEVNVGDALCTIQ